MKLGKKSLLIVWYFVLWTAGMWAFYESSYPQTNYGGGSTLDQVAIYGLMVLFFATVIPLFRYFRKHSKVASIILIAATIVMVSFLIPNVTSSIQNKAHTQTYIIDLQKQGFTVVYSPQYPYFHGPETTLNSYAQVVTTARNLNCSTIYLHGGTPDWFVFFFPSQIIITFFVYNEGYYMYYVNPADAIKAV